MSQMTGVQHAGKPGTGGLLFQRGRNVPLRHGVTGPLKNRDFAAEALRWIHAFSYRVSDSMKKTQ
jgi:hypothetical protein